MLYFGLAYLERHSNRTLVGFFTFAVLAVYSQYGAVFVVVPLYLLLAYDVIRNKHKFAGIIGCTLGIGAPSALVLFVFFLLPQMLRQGSAMVSHAPVFRHGGFLDFFVGAISVVKWIFMPVSGVPSAEAGLLAFGGFTAVLCMIAFIINKKYREIFLALAVSYVLYFAAVVCSFYGYNNWSPDMVGADNFGERYSLFFAPLFVVTSVIGVYYGMQIFRSKIMWILLRAVSIACVVFVCGTMVTTMRLGWTKSDVREATQSWYENGGPEVTTLVHDWTKGGFCFYLMHNVEFEEEYSENIVLCDLWIRTASSQTMRERLKDQGIFDLDRFYYVGPYVKYRDSYDTFCQVAQEEGYDITVLFQGMTTLLELQKR